MCSANNIFWHERCSSYVSCNLHFGCGGLTPLFAALVFHALYCPVVDFCAKLVCTPMSDCKYQWTFVTVLRICSFARSYLFDRLANVYN